MANFNEIDKARKLLGLGEVATLKEIKRAYRTLHRLALLETPYSPAVGIDPMRGALASLVSKVG